MERGTVWTKTLRTRGVALPLTGETKPGQKSQNLRAGPSSLRSALEDLKPQLSPPSSQYHFVFTPNLCV